MVNVPKLSKKEPLKMNEKDLKELQRIRKSRTEAKSRNERATMMLMYNEGTTITEIARIFNTNRPKVERLIKKALELGVIAALDDLPRPGKPGIITPEAKTWLVSVACQKPKELGYQQELWTMSLLAAYARETCAKEGHPSLEKINKGTVSKILAAHDIKPHKIRYYVERRDPQFDEKMAHILCLYKEVEVARNHQDETTAYVSYDEKPGIQAIETTSPDLMPVPGQHKTLYRDYEYKRHGTLSLLAGIDLITGKIIASIEEKHRSAEFVSFLKKLNQEYADKDKIRIVLDNHSAHISKETRAYLATVPNRFEFIFTPKHGSWLNLIESFFGKLARTLLRGIRVESKEELKERILQHIDMLNQTPVVYRWKYKMDEITLD